MKKNILLIGMMGCGKTTLGKILSKRLSYNFIDIDNYIEYMFFLKVDVTLPSITTNPTYLALMEGTIIRSCTSRDILIDTSYGYKNSSGGTTSTDPVISNYLQDNKI